MTIKLLSLLMIFLNFGFSTLAQDTLTMYSGKTLVVKNAALMDNSVIYQTLKKGKSKKVRAENVFSIKYADGNERVLYEPDRLEPDDYSVNEMRMFIKGEEDAIKYYRNDLVKVGAFAIGFGSATFTLYGIVGPVIFSSVAGSFSPAIDKQKVSDPDFLKDNGYKDGYERKMQNIKTKNSLLFGLAGFVAGIITFSVLDNNSN